MVASEAAYMRCVSSRPYIEISLLTPSFIPVSTMPPLRELAPQPMVSDSSTATLAPRLAKRAGGGESGESRADHGDIHYVGQRAGRHRQWEIPWS